MASFLQPLLKNLRIQRAEWWNFSCLMYDRVNSQSCFSCPALAGSFSSGKRISTSKVFGRETSTQAFYLFQEALEISSGFGCYNDNMNQTAAFADLRDWCTHQEFRQEVRNKNYSTLSQYIWDTWWIDFWGEHFSLACHNMPCENT